MLRDMTPEQLCVIHDIKALKYAYVRCLDQKDWRGMSALFTPDATASYSGGKYHYEGRDAIVGFLETNLSRPTFHTSHRMHHPEITLEDAESATGVWAMDDINVDPELDFFLVGAGFYDDAYVLVDDRWLITHTGYRRTFETVMSMSAAKMNLTASWWSTDGQSMLAVS